MSNEQLYIAIGLPVVLNLLITLTAFSMLSARMRDGFAAINTRFDDMRDLWRSELRRVEEVLDARLKNLEERR